MGRRLYVGNLPYSLTDDDLRKIFESQGKVIEATVIVDKPTQKSKGFGFVEMETEAEAARAMLKLDGFDVKNRNLKVGEAKMRTEYDGGKPSEKVRRPDHRHRRERAFNGHD